MSAHKLTGSGRGAIRSPRPLSPNSIGYRMRVLCAVGAMLALGACGNGEMDDLHAYIATVKARQHGPIEPLPEFAPYETFTYKAHNLRDPFLPFLRPAVARGGDPNGLRPDINRPREALEEFPLDALRMVGILERQGERWALVRAPNGTIHRVKPGNHLGQNFGRVLAVRDNQIEVREIISDGLGGWIERGAALALATQ
jgi:type IV pilus assembly protein PilP